MGVILIVLIVVVVFLIWYAIVVSNIAKLYYERTQDEIAKVKKMIRMNESLSRWLELKQKKVSIKEYFEKNNYKTVAVYGMGDMGKKLFFELKQSGIEVSFTLDNRVDLGEEYKMIPITDKVPMADVIIVTAVNNFNDIYLALRGQFSGEIVNIEDILWSV